MNRGKTPLSFQLLKPTGCYIEKIKKKRRGDRPILSLQNRQMDERVVIQSSLIPMVRPLPDLRKIDNLFSVIEQVRRAEMSGLGQKVSCAEPEPTASLTEPEPTVSATEPGLTDVSAEWRKKV